MATEHLLLERRDGVLYVTMNRPAKLNALSEEMMTGLVAELTSAKEDPEVGAIVLTGAGRGFCSGGDVSAIRAGFQGKYGPSQSFDQAVAFLRHLEESSLLLHEMPKVTIAAVNGVAAGAGLSLALACDIRIGCEDTRIGTAFARVGLSGDFGGTWLLTRVIGPSKARELYFSAETIGAQEALRLGLLNRLVASASLADEVHSYAAKIAAGPRVAYAYMKTNLNLALTCDLRANLDREAITMRLCGRTEDHREAINAFLEKREPKFRGR